MSNSNHSPSPSVAAHRAIYRVAAAAVLALVLVRLYGAFAPSALTWGIDYFADLPFGFIAAYAAVGVIAALWLWQLSLRLDGTQHASLPAKYSSASLVLPLAGAAFIAAALAFRVRLPLLGDSFIAVQNFENTFKGVHALHLGNEPLAQLVFSTVFRFMGITSYPAMLDGFLAAEILLGALFIALAFTASGLMSPEPRDRNLLFWLMLALPVLQVFFGYAEIYAVPAAAIMGYVVASLAILRGRARIEFAIVAFLVSLFTHYLAVIFLPSLYYVLWRTTKPSDSRKSLATPYAVTLAVVAGVAALWVLVSREGSSSHILSIVPDASDPRQAYSLFSPYHASELVNLVLLYSPFLPLMLWMALFTGARSAMRELLDDEKIAFLGVATAGYLLFVLTAKFDLGVAADWDVSAPYGAVRMLFVASLLLALRREPAVRASFRNTLAVVMLMGFAQSVPWFYLNSTVEPALARSKRLLDARTVSPDGNYQGVFHLSYAYGTLAKPDSAADIWHAFTVIYPGDWRGWQNYAHQAVEAGRLEDPSVEAAYARAFQLDTSKRMQREYSLYYADRARRAFEHGRADSTIYMLQRAIAVDSSNAGAWFNLASVYDAVGDINSATSAYFDLLDRSPRFLPGFEGLIKNLLKLGSPQAAVEIGEKALSFSAGTSAIRQSLAEAYTKLNRPADAQRVLAIGN